MYAKGESGRGGQGAPESGAVYGEGVSAVNRAGRWGVAIRAERFKGNYQFAFICVNSLVLLSDLGCGSVTQICA